MDVLPRSSPNVIEYDVNPPNLLKKSWLSACMYVCFEEAHRKYQIKKRVGFCHGPCTGIMFRKVLIFLPNPVSLNHAYDMMNWWMWFGFSTLYLYNFFYYMSMTNKFIFAQKFLQTPQPDSRLSTVGAERFGCWCMYVHFKTVEERLKFVNLSEKKKSLL